jgi:hypothetical protein
LFIAPVWVRLGRRPAGRDSEYLPAAEKLEHDHRLNVELDLDSAAVARLFRW